MGSAADQDSLLQDVTPYGARSCERRQGERRQQMDRRLGHENRADMRLFRFIRSRLFHLPEHERHLPDRRKSDRRVSEDGSDKDRNDPETPLLSQEEIQFLLRGGFA